MRTDEHVTGLKGSGNRNLRIKERTDERTMKEIKDVERTDFLSRLPLPITAVSLSLASLGNLLEPYSEGIRLFCGGLAFVLLFAFFVKILRYPRLFKEDMKNPVMASVFCTFSMTIILLSAYIRPYLGPAAAVIWYFGIGPHTVLVLYFTWNFMRKPVFSRVYACYFIGYEGFVTASVTAEKFDALAVGQAAFWFGFCMLFVLIPFITYRYVTLPQVEDPAKPLFCIYTAPPGLCLTGYLHAFPEPSPVIAGFLTVLCLFMYTMVCSRLPGFLRLPFYPSYASFTFPFVISATGITLMGEYLHKIGSPVFVLDLIGRVQTAAAVILISYVLLRFILYTADYHGTHTSATTRRRAA